MARTFYVYIMASRSRVLYTGITNNIRRRTREHKERHPDTFTAKHRCTNLVFYEIFRSPTRAIAREKQLKSWTRAKKIALIEETNPNWRDLSEDWGKPISPPTAFPTPPQKSSRAKRSLQHVAMSEAPLAECRPFCRLSS